MAWLDNGLTSLRAGMTRHQPACELVASNCNEVTTILCEWRHFTAPEPIHSATMKPVSALVSLPNRWNPAVLDPASIPHDIPTPSNPRAVSGVEHRWDTSNYRLGYWLKHIKWSLNNDWVIDRRYDVNNRVGRATFWAQNSAIVRRGWPKRHVNEYEDQMPKPRSQSSRLRNWANQILKQLHMMECCVVVNIRCCIIWAVVACGHDSSYMYQDMKSKSGISKPRSKSSGLRGNQIVE